MIQALTFWPSEVSLTSGRFNPWGIWEWKLIYHINYGVIQGFPALRKAVTTHEKKQRIFHVCLISPISCWTSLAFRATRSGWWRNGEVSTIFNPRSLVGIFSDNGCLNTKKFVSLRDSDVQTFLEGEEDKIWKEKPKVTYSVSLVIAFLAAKNESQQLEDLPQEDFGRVLRRLLLSVRTKC